MYQVGQQVYFAENEHRNRHNNGHLTVIKVGRKWIYLSNHRRFDAETGNVDGEGLSSPGRVWSTQQQYEEWRALNELWHKFMDLVSNRWNRPEHLSREDLEGMIKKVKGDGR